MQTETSQHNYWRTVAALAVWGFFAVASLCLLWFLWVLHLPWVAFYAYSDDELVQWLLLFILSAGLVFLWLRPRVSWRRWYVLSIAQNVWMITIIAAILGTANLAVEKQPLKLAFFFSQVEFEQIADDYRLNPTEIGSFAPQDAGVYRVYSVETFQLGQVFWVDDKKGKTDRYGFARLPGQQEDLIHGHKHGLHYSSMERIAGDWYVVYDSYRYSKRGWS